MISTICCYDFAMMGVLSFLTNAIFNNDAAIDNWAKNKKSSYTLGIDIDTMQNRIAGNSSVYENILQALGIVNQGNVYSQSAYTSSPTNVNENHVAYKTARIWQRQNYTGNSPPTCVKRKKLNWRS